ncbi:MAG TPA: curli assembly protein CsgF [Rhodothermales bacterium]
MSIERPRRAGQGRLFAALSLFVILVIGAGPARAQQFVYHPVNPAFGGPYLNASWLLQSAEAQKDFASTDRGGVQRSPIDDFQQSLQRQILSQLSRELIIKRFGNLDLTKEGKFDLGDYIVEVTPGLNGISIRVFDALSGDESIITIPSF